MTKTSKMKRKDKDENSVKLTSDGDRDNSGGEKRAVYLKLT